MTKHVLYGGSSAEIWRHCPGWAGLIQQVPRKPVGAAAHTGTAQHHVMERLLKDPDLVPEKFLGAKILTEGGDVELHQGHIAAIEIALEAWLDLLADYPLDVRFDGSDGLDIVSYGEPQVFSERFFRATDDQGGTVDGLVVRAPRASFVDFKFGQYEVDAEGWQNFWYMLCARAQHPELFEGVTEWESVIIQPAYDPAIDRHVITTADLDRMALETSAAILKSKQPNPDFIEGDWCRWCNAKLVCPAKTQRLDTLTAPNHILDLHEVERQLMKLREWRKWEEEAEQRLLHELEHGWQGELFKLVGKRAIRKWSNEADVIGLLKKKRIPAKDYMRPAELRSPASMEEEGFLTRGEVKTLANPVSSGVTIAVMSDKRPAILPRAALAEALKR
jgi:hypothetical protein